MNSQTLIQQTNSKLGLRVRLWKDTPGVQLSPVLSIDNTKAVFSQPEWVRKVSVRFDAIPTIFHIELSDNGAYSNVKAPIGVGATSVTVVDTTGWEVGNKIILRAPGYTDKFTINGVSGDSISFDGETQNAYGITHTVEDDRWYRVATARCDATATWVNLGEPVDDHPMQTAYGQYWRIGPGTVQINDLTDFRLYPDTYYDLTDYVEGPIDIVQSADLRTGASPLSTCNIRLLNTDDRFGRRNLSNPYIDGTVNYMRRSNRVTVEWIACGPDWELATSGGVADWRLLGTFKMRRPTISRNEMSYAVLEGEALSQLRYSVDVPLIEIATVRELMGNWILTQEHREALAEGADDAVKHKIAVLETDELDRTNSAFQEIIGRGDFGNCKAFYYDSSEEELSENESPVLYSGFYGIASDGAFLYTCHSMEKPEGTAERGMYIIKRFMSGIPVGADDIFMFYESDTTDIEEGDICFVGDTMWLHNAQQNVTNNVFKIDFSDADEPSVSDSYAAKGSAGHLPVHAASDGTYLYVLYDGGAEGRTLYKCNAATYATIWSFQFTGPMNTTLDGATANRGGGVSGMAIIGSSTLLIFTYRIDDAGGDRKYIAVRYALQDVPAYVAEATTDPTIEFITKMNPAESLNNTYGWASVVQTSAGLLGMTGGAEGIRGQPQKGATSGSKLWESRGGAISKIATIRFFAQNGSIINNADDYTDARAQKDSANYDLEEVWVGGEIQDNTGTYSGTTKTTDNYIINLLTGEILFLTPPQHGASVKINYDFVPSVQFFKADNIPRWETIRSLAQVASGIAYVTKEGRVSVKLRRGQEDHVFTSAAPETVQLRGRNIIHDSNSAYSFNSLQVANADHNYFYIEGTHYGITYDAGTGVYSLTEVGSSLEGHIVITYIRGPSDDSLILFDDDGQANPPTILGPLDESWSFADIYNSIIISGERSYPLGTPITYRETYAISPQQLGVDAPFSKVQRAEATAQYDWDGDRKVFLTAEEDNISGSGFVVDFQDPLIIGTTKWILREPDTSHVEDETATEGGATGFQRVTWDAPFLESGSAVETTNYDILLTNKSYWRVCRKEDEKDGAWPVGWFYKTGSQVVLKKFRDDDVGGALSDNCTAYAYTTKDTSFYIDEAGVIQEAEISDATNPSPSASPDKSIYVRIGAVDEMGAHLFRQAGTYDSVSISADYAVYVGAVRIGYDGVSVDVNNYADAEQFLQLLVVGYPISGIERVRVKCEDRITLDGSLSAIEKMSERTMKLDNEFIQSVGVARTVGYGLLDWLKTDHSDVVAQDRFNDLLSILDPCLIRAAYGNFDEELELWLVSEVHYSLVKGDSGMSTTTYKLVDMDSSPSAPPAGSS